MFVGDGGVFAEEQQGHPGHCVHGSRQAAQTEQGDAGRPRRVGRPRQGRPPGSHRPEDRIRARLLVALSTQVLLGGEIFAV